MPMKRPVSLYRYATRVTRSDVHVIIYGETGSVRERFYV